MGEFFQLTIPCYFHKAQDHSLPSSIKFQLTQKEFQSKSYNTGQEQAPQLPFTGGKGGKHLSKQQGPATPAQISHAKVQPGSPPVLQRQNGESERAAQESHVPTVSGSGKCTQCHVRRHARYYHWAKSKFLK